MGLEEGGVEEEEEGFEQSWGILILLRLGKKSSKTEAANGSNCYSSIERLNIGAIGKKVTTLGNC